MSEQTSLQVFNNSDFGQVRTVEENGKVLFCGSDIAKALGYTNTRKALADHCKGVTKRDTPTNGGIQELSFIPEGDVYRLITHSKLESAERFESWVFDEVLPTIQKTGTYTAKPLSQLEILQGSINLLAQQDKRIEKLETKIDTALARPVLHDWRSWANNAINSVIGSAGLNYQTYRHELYQELESTARCNLTSRVSRLKERMRKAGHKCTDCRAVTKIHVIEDDPKLKAIFEGIIKRESAREA